MKVVFLEPLGIKQEALEKMAKESFGSLAEIVCYDNRNEETDELISRSRDADIVVLSNFKYRREVISQCPKLKMICVAFTGVDHVDMEYCREKGIAVCNCAGYSTVAVADLVFGMVIALARKLLECNRVVREGGTKAGLVGFELEGKTFGVIGTGAIGLRVAKIADAFGCRVIAYSRTKKDIPYIEYVELDELLKQSDIISLHVPQNEKTVGLIGEREISLMKKTALLINAARGPVVDYAALSKALKNKDIAGAGIDVFEVEPPVAMDHPLFGAPNVIATPHVAFASEQSMQKRAVIVMDNIKGYIDGKIINLVK